MKVQRAQTQSIKFTHSAIHSTKNRKKNLDYVCVRLQAGLAQLSASDRWWYKETWIGLPDRRTSDLSGPGTTVQYYSLYWSPASLIYSFPLSRDSGFQLHHHVFMFRRLLMVALSGASVLGQRAREVAQLPQHFQQWSGWLLCCRLSASLQRRYLPGDRRGSRADQPAVPDYPFPDALIHYLSLLPNDPLTMKILGDGQATGLPNKSSSFSSSITSKQLFIQHVYPLGASLQLLHLHHAPESSSRIHHRCATRNVLLCVNNTFKRHFNSSHCRPVLTIQLHTTHIAANIATSTISPSPSWSLVDPICQIVCLLRLE